MEISRDNCMDLVAAKFPDFAPVWNSCKLEHEISNEEVLGFTPFLKDTSFQEGMFEFSSYVIDLLIQKEQNPYQIKEIFAYTEFLLEYGDEDVKNIVATCFLENIINVTPTKIDPKRFVDYLGFESRKYCQAWDEFTGVKTEGL